MPHPEFVLQPGDVFNVECQAYILYDYEVRTGGSIAWFNNNPGNIRPDASHEAERYGAYAGKVNYRFAIFPDKQTGFNAIKSYLRARPNRSILSLMESYAPWIDGNNNPTVYAQNIANRLQVSESTLIGSLREDQLEIFAAEIQRIEGWRAGTSYSLDALPDAVLQALTDPATQPTTMLLRGDRNDSVTYLQSLLQARGHTLQVDGIFGPGTEAAVKAFQRAANLTADGIVGAKTWCALIG